MEFLCLLKASLVRIREGVFGEADVKSWQGLVIAITLFLYVLLPKVDQSDLPNSFVESFHSVNGVLAKIDPTYAAFGLWICFLLVETLSAIPRAFQLSEGTLGWRRTRGTVNFLIDILMVIALFGPLMFLVVIPTGLVIVALGIGLIGEKFTLLLGFFVFPRVIVWLHSWLILLFFLMAPKRLRSGTPVQGE